METVMSMTDGAVVNIIQDQRSLMSALLVIQEALETGELPKSFLLFHDEWICNTINRIALIMRDKYGIKVPETEI